jgi:hypothetical protein
MRFMVMVKATKDVEWTKRFIRVAGDGETEIRELHDTPAFANS